MIRIAGLVKTFGATTALRDVDLEVPAGEVCGLIGPNGAGKTTLLRILATVLRPTRGDVTIAGLRLPAEAAGVRPRIGYMPDSFAGYDELRVDAFLAFFAHVYRLPRDTVWPRIQDILELVDLARSRNMLVSALSLGSRQRLGLARVLIHNPDVLLLDEPVSGLDPRARVEIRELLRELGRMGKTVLISSHVLSDLAGVCDRFAVVDRGAVRFSGTVGELKARVSPQRTVEVRVDGDGGGAPPEKRLARFLEGQRWALAVRARAAGVEVDIEDRVALADVARQLFQAGFSITRFIEREADLEDAFLKLTSPP